MSLYVFDSLHINLCGYNVSFEKSTEAINFFGTAIAPGAGSRFGFVPGVVPQMDLPKGIVAPALPLRWYIY